MRIAISGTHCCGKSTLIDEFLSIYPNFTHEPEAYEALQDEHGETFPANPVTEDYYRQLEYCVGRLQQYSPGDCVIFERCPADYLAYMQQLRDLGRDSEADPLAESCLDKARDAMKHLDIVMFVRPRNLLNDVSDDEDAELRSLVDAKLKAILFDNEIDLISETGPLILDGPGSTTARLRLLATQDLSHYSEN